MMVDVAVYGADVWLTHTRDTVRPTRWTPATTTEGLQVAHLLIHSSSGAGVQTPMLRDT